MYAVKRKTLAAELGSPFVKLISIFDLCRQLSVIHKSPHYYTFFKYMWATLLFFVLTGFEMKIVLHGKKDFPG